MTKLADIKGRVYRIKDREKKREPEKAPAARPGPAKKVPDIFAATMAEMDLDVWTVEDYLQAFHRAHGRQLTVHRARSHLRFAVAAGLIYIVRTAPQHFAECRTKRKEAA